MRRSKATMRRRPVGDGAASPRSGSRWRRRSPAARLSCSFSDRHRTGCTPGVTPLPLPSRTPRKRRRTRGPRRLRRSIRTSSRDRFRQVGSPMHHPRSSQASGMPTAQGMPGRLPVGTTRSQPRPSPRTMGRRRRWSQPLVHRRSPPRPLLRRRTRRPRPRPRRAPSGCGAPAGTIAAAARGRGARARSEFLGVPAGAVAHRASPAFGRDRPAPGASAAAAAIRCADLKPCGRQPRRCCRPLAADGHGAPGRKPARRPRCPSERHTCCAARRNPARLQSHRERMGAGGRRRTSRLAPHQPLGRGRVARPRVASSA